MSGKIVAMFCAVVCLAACGKRMPTDEQLGQLLRAESASASPGAGIDHDAVTCLRAWSGDVELRGHLSADAVSEASKADCRKRLEAWIADRGRNPAAFRFEDISAPPVVRKVVELQQAARRGKADADLPPMGGGAVVPPALSRQVAKGPVAAPAEAAPPVDLGEVGVRLRDAESACEKVEHAVASGLSDPNAAAFARSCGPNLRTLRGAMENAVRGNDSKRLEQLSMRMDSLTNKAIDILAASGN